MQLCRLLEIYPDAVIAEATDTILGLPSKYKFPPAISEVREFCDAVQVRRYQLEHSKPIQIRRERLTPADPCNVFVPANVPVYARLCKLVEVDGSILRKIDPGGRAGWWVPLDVALAAGASRTAR